MKITGPVWFSPAAHEARSVTVDVCVYGGVSGGVIAAVEAAERGWRVALLVAGWQVGGMTSGGLGMTDIGNKTAIGGKAREFYQRVGRHYGADIEWRFEPSVAEKVFEDWLVAAGVQVFRGEYIDGVVKDGATIQSLLTVSGLRVSARMFVDATYEGDLLAKAGVSYAVGREDNSVHGETLNGQHIRGLHQFGAAVDPYVTPGAPGSGLLPGIDADSHYCQGAGDRRVQAYNFRMCLTRRPELRLPFPKPAAYNEAWYVLLKRWLATGWNEAFEKFDPVRNGKTDTNNHGAVSTDFIGQNHAFAEADYALREKIFQAHVTWQQGLMWCLSNDLAVPAAIREPMREWGLCRDEFPAFNGWSYALYVREARRLLGPLMMTEHHCTGAKMAEHSIGLAAYGMDSHNCRRLVVNGSVMNEGDVQVHVHKPYPLPFEAIVPRREECDNLLVTFCVSASHIAFGSIRMEPVFMVLSQSAAIAADMALREGTAVQAVNYTALRAELLKQGQILDVSATRKVDCVHEQLIEE